MIVFALSGIAAGDLLFQKERRFLKVGLVLATFLLIVTLLGTFLILIASYTELVSLVGFVATGLLLCVLSAFKNRANPEEALPEQKKEKNATKKAYLLGFPFAFSAAIAFYALYPARTGEGQVSRALNGRGMIGWFQGVVAISRGVSIE